jgi:hypothetical protein
MLMDISIFSKLWRSVTGLRLNQWQMLKSQAHVFMCWSATMNTAEGISRKDDTLPTAFFDRGAWMRCLKSGRFRCNPCWLPTTGFVDMTPMASQPEKTLKRLGIIAPNGTSSSDRAPGLF